MSDTRYEPGALTYLSASELADLGTKSEEPTCQLKFIDGMLHQMWWVTTYRGGLPRTRNSEWRLVPSVPSKANGAEP